MDSFNSRKRIKLEPRNSELNDILSMLINSEEFNSSILSIDTSSYPIKKNEVKKDDPSVKGHFGWQKIGEQFYVPFILRTSGNCQFKLVSPRINELLTLKKFLTRLESKVLDCMSIVTYKATTSECKLLNEIVHEHFSRSFNKMTFKVDEDILIRIEDAQLVYLFLDTCYNFLYRNVNMSHIFGYIRINHAEVVPYCIKNNDIYVPLLFFEYSDSDNMKRHVYKLHNWHIAFLKLCCMIQGINSHLYMSDQFGAVFKLDEIKQYFPENTDYQKFCPPKTIIEKLLKKICIVENPRSICPALPQHPPQPRQNTKLLHSQPPNMISKTKPLPPWLASRLNHTATSAVGNFATLSSNLQLNGLT